MTPSRPATGTGSTSPIGVCYLLDVAQGNAAVIYVGTGRNRRTFIVDCGHSGEEILDLLRRLAIDAIDRVILTHNDADHARGLRNLVRTYRGRIHQLWMLVDRVTGGWRDSSGLARRALLEAVEGAVDAGRIEQVRNLVMATDSPLVVYGGRDIQMRLLFPQFSHNLRALLAGDPNLTSGILELTCAPGRLLFAGDAPLPVWQWILQKHGLQECDVLVVPHHGGHIHPDTSLPDQQRQDELVALYRDIIRTRFAVISVGTTNQHEHPRPEHIEAIRQSGAAILCTQITARCCSDPSQHVGGILGPHPNAPQRSAGGGRPDVACAGTIQINLVPGSGMEPDRCREHRQAVESLYTRLLNLEQTQGGSVPRPRCLPSPPHQRATR